MPTTACMKRKSKRRPLYSTAEKEKASSQTFANFKKKLVKKVVVKKENVWRLRGVSIDRKKKVDELIIGSEGGSTIAKEEA